MVKVESVRKGSYADRAGISAGDELIGVNGNTIHDVLDYRFHICNEKLDILSRRDGKEYHAKIKKTNTMISGWNLRHFSWIASTRAETNAFSALSTSFRKE